MTTTELSTSIPTPSARPDSEIMFSVTPLKYISTMATITLKGMLKATTMVGFTSFRKKASTITASRAPQIRLLSTLFTISLM